MWFCEMVWAAAATSSPTRSISNHFPVLMPTLHPRQCRSIRRLCDTTFFRSFYRQLVNQPIERLGDGVRTIRRHRSLLCGVFVKPGAYHLFEARSNRVRRVIGDITNPRL